MLAAAMAPRITVTADLLRQAWQHRRRANWPATYDDCMADGLLRSLVQAEAMRLALALRRKQVQLPPVPPTRAAMPRPTTPARGPRPPALRDLKRAAAGDASDD